MGEFAFQTLRESITSAIRSKILTGELQPGAKLAEQKLAEEFGSSRAPIREALRQLDAAKKQLPGCVRSFRGYQKKITKGEFEAAFSDVYAMTEPVFRMLDEAVSSIPDETDARLLESANAFLDELELDWAANRNRNGARDDDKMVIAIFLVPAIRKLELPTSEAFCKALQAEWVRRYPKTPFYLGDYEAISTGFRKKLFGLCFITTAVCEELGKPDDCEELTAFRAFRDGYLRACPDGETKAVFSERVCRAFAALVDRALADGEETLVILAHGGTQMAAMERYALPHADYYHWCAPNAGGYVLDAGDWAEQRVLHLLKTVQYTKEDAR